jgi:hypothetical protein
MSYLVSLLTMTAWMWSAQGTAQALTIDKVGWLQGCWQLISGERVVEEQWMAPRAKSMLGMGRTIRGDTLVEYESVLIKEQDGRLAYQAHPSGQPSATFLATAATDSQVVFENPTHDFPQRVGYRRDGADGLVAWIDGVREGKTRKVEFPYRRTACAEK